MDNYVQDNEDTVNHLNWVWYLLILVQILYKPNVFKKSIVAYNNVCRNFFTIAKGGSMSALYVSNGLDSLYHMKKCQNCVNH